MREVNIEAEKKQLARLGQDWWEAENRKDVGALMEVFSDDVIVQPANVPQLIGKDAVRNFFEDYYKTLVSSSGEQTRIEVASSGDMANEAGTMKVVMKGPEGTIEDEQKYLAVYKKIEGKWKCTALSASSDKPPV